MVQEVKMKRIKDLKKGDYFVRNCTKLHECEEVKSSLVWVRGEYNHSVKAYEVYKFDDINHTAFITGNTLVKDDIIF